MSSDVPPTTDASVLDFKETDPQEQVSAAQWRPEGLRCQCGADITEWHPPAQARKLARYYGCDEWDVPACPSCTDRRDGGDDARGVASAVRMAGEHHG